jgi:hypothetical protein
MRLVTAASAESTVKGSNRSTCGLWLVASASSAPEVPMLSAMNSMSSLPRSMVFANSIQRFSFMPASA